MLQTIWTLFLCLLSGDRARQTLLHSIIDTFRKYYDHDWVEGGEIDLYGAVYDPKHPFGSYLLESRERRVLRALAWRAGGWFIYPEDFSQPAFVFHSQLREALKSPRPVPMLQPPEGGYATRRRNH